ncbi:MAG: hypothetical protein IJ365_08960 [Clostridia bacterium]|nr:hypothetical protein [Clostridia bacterium]
MELTEIRSSLFGYKKADVVRYISELNELHTAELDNKSFEYKALKDETDAMINILKENGATQKNSIADLQGQVEAMAAELSKTAAALEEYKNMYDTLNVETEELRTKSNAISTAIINAEKCAGTLVDEARQNADNIMQQAQAKVDFEKQKLIKAKGCVADIRAQLSNVMMQINSALGTAESDIEVKIKSMDKV